MTHSQLRYGDPAESAEAAAELDELGFSALWIPDVGGPVFETFPRDQWRRIAAACNCG